MTAAERIEDLLDRITDLTRHNIFEMQKIETMHDRILELRKELTGRRDAAED